MTAPQATYPHYIDQDPYPFFESLRQRGPVVWDSDMASWLVTSFDDCSYILRNEDLFAAPWPRLGFAELFGRRGLFLLAGEEHRQLYVSVRRFFSPSQVEQYRAQFIEPLVNDSIDRIAEQGRSELARDFAEQIPVRVIAGILGLDWRDADLARECWEWTGAWVAHTGNFMLPHGAAEKTRQGAVDAMRKLDDVLRPVVRNSGDRAQESYLGMITQVGPRLFPDWTEEDTLDQCRFLFVAGMHTTSALICNAAYRMLTDQGVLERLRLDSDGVPAYVEEVLRLYPSLHFRVRIATEDTELNGTAIKGGDQVLAILAAANRCPDRYPEPNQLNFEPAQPTSHLAFNAGPRFCGGAPLARLEATLAVRALAERLPGLRLDPDASPPKFEGFLQRSLRPLHVLFDAQLSTQSRT